jgi:FSR family fosmidomycin resistance protein-like MFS transporter
MLIAGMLLSATCMGAVGAVDTYWMMVVLMTMAGIGNSVFHPADYAILAAAVGKQHLGKAFGFHLMSGNLGFAVAPVMMVSLAVLWDWRTAIIVVGIAGVAVGLSMAAFGRDLHTGTAQRHGNDIEASSTSGASSLTSPPLLMMLAFFILLALANTGIQTFSVTTLNAVYGTELGVANTALTFFLASGFVGVAVGGFVADRLKRPVVVVVGAMVVCAVCLAVIGWQALPAVALFAAMGIGGAAIGLMRPARDMMVNAITPPGATGKAFGFVGTGLSIGGAVAPVAFGWLIDTGAASWVFMLCAGFIVLSIVAALAVDRMSRREEQMSAPSAQ